MAFDYLAKLGEIVGLRCESVSLYNNGTGFTKFIHDMYTCTENGVIRNGTNCKCDIGIAGWMLNEERFGLVDFLPPFMIDEVVVATSIENTSRSSDAVFFLKSFTTPVWLGIGGLIALFTFLKMLDRRFAPPDSSFKPLPKTASRFRRYRQVLLKSKIPFRLRKAAQSTSMFWFEKVSF